ncbi:MAG: hypothetical protein U9Q22_03075, partial [Candidatus Altiarchaeota archaeon]|nr:hypothetical protein [Candidatus Altiarchaeota archaeon]
MKRGHNQRLSICMRYKLLKFRNKMGSEDDRNGAKNYGDDREGSRFNPGRTCQQVRCGFEDDTETSIPVGEGREAKVGNLGEIVADGEI